LRGDQPQRLRHQPAGVGMDGEIVAAGDLVEPQQVDRVALEGVVVDDGEALALQGEIGMAERAHPPALGEGADQAGQAGARLLLARLQRGADDRGEVADILGDEEIGLHEALDRRLATAAGITDRGRDLALQVEGKPLFGPAGDEVHPAAHPPEEFLRALEHRELARIEQPGLDQLGRVVDAVGILGDPEQRVEIAQAALAVLDIGLDQIARRAGASDAALALGELGFGEDWGRALGDLCTIAPDEIGEQSRIAADQSRFQERGADRHIRPALADAVVDRADGMADLQLQIPERIKHGLDHALAPGGLLVGEKKEQIDIRARRQRPPTVAADRDHGDALAGRGVLDGIEMACRRRVQAGDDAVHHAR